MQPKGYLSIVLHAHLPYVRHPEHEEFLEEDWFFEAMTETYIPLIHVFERLHDDGVPFQVTLSVSPTLASMMNDSLLTGRYLQHLNKLIELASKEVERTRWMPEFHRLALMYYFRLTFTRTTFVDRYSRNLIHAFRRFAELGHLELMTCGATHGFLPLMAGNERAMRAQIQIAARTHEQFFGAPPRGIWLPECGFDEKVVPYLKEAGIKYFFTDTHGVLHASPRPRFGVYAPILCPGTGVACFGRDMESSKQVWSAEEGYPGDYWYRDFYRDVGFDLDFEYVKPYIHHMGIRKCTGIKYYRITGKSEHKEVYDPQVAREKAASHAGNFLFNREKQVEHLYGLLGKEPIIVAPYDAELYGHWWYEGPEWLEFLARKMAFDQETVKLITPSNYLEKFPTHQIAMPSASSWGYKGYAEVWLNGTNDWVYRHLHQASDRMIELAGRHPDEANSLTRRALNQAARELLLAQGSDWAFIMNTGTMVEYAVKRTKSHIDRFNRLYDAINRNTVDPSYLGEIEWKDNLFPQIDYRVYA
jgi:1,4-alpha-glucan branching enzyme